MLYAQSECLHKRDKELLTRTIEENNVEKVWLKLFTKANLILWVDLYLSLNNWRSIETGVEGFQLFPGRSTCLVLRNQCFCSNNSYCLIKKRVRELTDEEMAWGRDMCEGRGMDTYTLLLYPSFSVHILKSKERAKNMHFVAK